MFPTNGSETAAPERRKKRKNSPTVPGNEDGADSPSPPAWVFGIVWTILFFLMGISAYMVYTSDANSDRKRNALIIYGVQLIFNLLWSIFFFNKQWYWFSFAWLIVLWFLILTMIVMFSNISRKAALLQIPYLLWVTFAGYLTAGVAILN